MTVLFIGCGGGGGGGGGSGGGGAGGTTTSSTAGSGGTTGVGGTTTGTGGTGNTTTTPTAGTGGTTTGSGGSCGGAEPVLPPGPCAPAAPICHSTTNACLATTEFGGASSFQMRIAQLAISLPLNLTAAKNPVVAGVLAKGVTPSLQECNLDGSSTISWLLSFDLGAQELTHGGAELGPAGDGPFQFASGVVDDQLGETYSVAPVTTALSIVQGCQFVSAPADVTIQLFVSDPSNYVLLPLTGLQLTGQISTEHNCIGRYDSAALDPASQCFPPAYQNGGSMAGLISLQRADGVAIQSLKKSLCALLVGEDDGGQIIKRCKKDAAGTITSKGDACLATGGAATPDCADALFYKADFAASGVTVTP